MGSMGKLPVAAKPSNILEGIIASSKAHEKRPGHVIFVTILSGFCKCSEHILSYNVLNGPKCFCQVAADSV